jgi:hypothetical protein
VTDPPGLPCEAPAENRVPPHSDSPLLPHPPPRTKSLRPANWLSPAPESRAGTPRGGLAPPAPLPRVRRGAPLAPRGSGTAHRESGRRPRAVRAAVFAVAEPPRLARTDLHHNPRLPLPNAPHCPPRSSPEPRWPGWLRLYIDSPTPFGWTPVAQSLRWPLFARGERFYYASGQCTAFCPYPLGHLKIQFPDMCGLGGDFFNLVSRAGPPGVSRNIPPVLTRNAGETPGVTTPAPPRVGLGRSIPHAVSQSASSELGAQPREDERRPRRFVYPRPPLQAPGPAGSLDGEV